MAELEHRLAARSAELTASKQLVQESEAREEAAFQVPVPYRRYLRIYLLRPVGNYEQFSDPWVPYLLSFIIRIYVREIKN